MQEKQAFNVLSVLPWIFIILMLAWTTYSSRTHREVMQQQAKRRATAEEQRLAEDRAHRAEADKKRDEAAAAEELRLATKVAGAEAEGSSTYDYAYKLLHPEEDMHENSEVVVRLLRRDRELEDIPPRELSLLYTAYNNLGQRDGNSFEVAETLWQNAPGTYRAIQVMTNAMHNKYMFSGDTAPIITFVDEQLSRGNGGEYELLLLKARALISDKKSPPDEKKKKMVSDVLVEAMAFPEVQHPDYSQGWSTNSAEYVLSERDFLAFFNTEEREELKARLVAAQQKTANAK